MEDLSLTFSSFSCSTPELRAQAVLETQVSSFQLVNLAVMQQDQTPFLSLSPGPMSETQNFWVDVRNTKFLGGPQLQQEPPLQLLPNAAAPGAGVLGCEPGSPPAGQ